MPVKKVEIIEPIMQRKNSMFALMRELVQGQTNKRILLIISKAIMRT